MTGSLLVAAVDFETAGDDPPTPVELGVQWLVVDRSGCRPVGAATAPLRYRGPPAHSARGVHHIPPGTLRRARHPAAVVRRHWQQGAMLVACHNAAYDYPVLQQLLARAGLPAPPPYVCTYRCARHLLPNAPDYRLSTLRYWLGLHPSPPAWAAPHRALYDAAVCAALLGRLLRLAPLGELVRLSDPQLGVLLPAVPFGQHRGVRWEDVPFSYLQWMLRTMHGDPQAFDVDARHSARTEFQRRRVKSEQEQQARWAAERDSQQRREAEKADKLVGGGSGTAAAHVAGPVELHDTADVRPLRRGQPHAAGADGGVGLGAAPGKADVGAAAAEDEQGVLAGTARVGDA